MTAQHVHFIESPSAWPEWVRYVAWDENGNAYGYSERPTADLDPDERTWGAESGFCARLNPVGDFYPLPDERPWHQQLYRITKTRYRLEPISSVPQVLLKQAAESDPMWIQRNIEQCRWFLENRDIIAKLFEQTHRDVECA